jgi:hypothetical protein
MAVLRDVYQYPQPDYLHGRQPRVVATRIDKAFDEADQALRRLAAVLPQSDHWNVLTAVLDDRIPPEESWKQLADQFSELERLSHAVAAERPLPPRELPSSRGRPIRNEEARVIVQAICWYLVNVEGVRRLKSGFDDETGAPTSRPARIIEATFVGMGRPMAGSEIQTHLNAVRKLKLNAVKHWELISVLPSPSGS